MRESAPREVDLSLKSVIDLHEVFATTWSNKLIHNICCDDNKNLSLLW